MPTGSISASTAVSSNRCRPADSFCSGLPASSFAHEPLARDLDCRVFARRTHVFAGLEGLLGKPLALGGAHTFDGRLVIVGGKVARDRAGGNFFGEKAQAQ